ncbi:MAG: hypothetical protein ACREBG_11520 [Pyrinomonadaceae bacterium]
MRRITRKERTKPEISMKKVTTQELISLAGIAIMAPVLALAIVISARAMAVAENDLLMFALVLCGIAVGAINGFGRRTIKAKTRSHNSRAGSRPGVALTS